MKNNKVKLKMFCNILFLFCVFWVSKCQTTCPVAKLITDLNQKNCTDRATNERSYYLDTKGCMPKCSIYPTEVQSDDCSKDSDSCMFGYNCESRCGSASSYRSTSCQVDADCYILSSRAYCSKYCVLPDKENDDDTVTCMAYHSNSPVFVDNYWTAKMFKPVCDDNGNWAPKQCKGGLQGRCLCYSAKGKRLFGQALYAEAANMTCACSRLKSDLESSGRNYVSLHCDSRGSFENLQCDVEKGICWCVESLTGELTAPFVPIVAMKKLPCYLKDNVGDQYLRQCESKKYATVMINAKLRTHGVVVVEPDTLLCDADGSYGAYSISSGNVHCTWRDNTQIESWFSDVGDTYNLNCNCARDYKMYAHSQSCESNGNYVILQQTLDEKGHKKYYCVDVDGFAKTDLLDDASTNCSLFY